MHAARRIVIVGAGRVGAGIITATPPGWGVTVVDNDPRPLAAIAPERTLTRVLGDASSRLVLGRCDLGPAVSLVLATRDDAVNLEAARIAQAEYGVQDVVAVLDAGTAPPGVDVIDRSDAVVRLLRRRIGGLKNAGSGRGELLQVPVLGGSPVIGRALRDLHRGDWLVAMIYRGEALVTPRGDTLIAEGDRVLLAGEPAELESVATYFRGGLPTFPAAWGSAIAWADPAGRAAALWLGEKTTAHEVVELPPGLLLAATPNADLAAKLRADDIGCLVVGPRPVPWAARVGLTTATWPARVRETQIPVMIARGDAAPERVVVALGPGHDARAIAGPGIDLARQANVPLVLLTVKPSAASPDADATEDTTADAVRYARLHGLEPTRVVEDGNPIARIRDVVRPTDLLVVGHGAVRRNSVFSPDVSLFLLHAAPGPVLFVPWTRAG